MSGSDRESCAGDDVPGEDHGVAAAGVHVAEVDVLTERRVDAALEEAPMSALV
jgi:hypothetical protein